MSEKENRKIAFDSTFSYKLIYIFRINDEAHRGCLKIGDATIHTDKDYSSLTPNCRELNYAAKVRINEYTSTAGISYELLYTEIAIYLHHYLDEDTQTPKAKLLSFRDHKVHEVLLRSGVKKKCFDTEKQQNEWFVTDLETAIRAIKAVKEEKSALDSASVTTGHDPIIFRPEQKKAISMTLERFKVSNKMLWNAKMRFGKTLCALEVAKEKRFKKTLILTHRPVVSEGWFEDFNLIFIGKDNYEFASKTKGKTIHELVSEGKSFVYFASMQDLRGSSAVGGRFDKDAEIYDTDWDFVVIDEGHEGTQTDLGKKVIERLTEKKKKQPKVLWLSGTPFNLLENYEQDDIYTWDYILEQQAKEDFALNHFGDYNPYSDLPKLNIFTYHLEKAFAGYMDLEDKAFNFREFFRIWTGDVKKDGKDIPSGSSVGDFVHKEDILHFLDLICKESDTTNYPFSSEAYRKLFRHTLWVVPGVKEAKALSALLRNHPVFGLFKIVNVAGAGDEEIDSKDALSAVKDAIGDNPDETYTITLSCGRLTTGVSVPAWTAVLMLAGSYSTAASQYLQTIFRVQTPANINGKTKENCYVFDFAPDRTLKMLAESVRLSAKAGKRDISTETSMKCLLNYSSVVCIDETRMKEFKVDDLLQALKKAYIEKVTKNGFDDPKLYNDELLKLDGVALKDFADLKQIVGASKQQKKAGDIDINHEGFSEEEYQKAEEAEEKQHQGKELTEEEKERLKKLKETQKNKETAISILRGISIRIPLMVYGVDKDINTDITIESFADPSLIDDLSWSEFMPKGVTREMFRKFSKYYDKDIFVGCCRRIRSISKTADDLEPTERVEKVASLFATFKNPDKETVLTPWRVVNLHMGEALGGYVFFDDKFENEIDDPRFVDKGETTSKVFNENSRILEINSKTGLYPLYVSYTLYRGKLNKVPLKEQTFEMKQEIWDEVIKNQVYVICKTPMAKMITKRTLAGYRDVRVNTKYFEDLVNQLRDKRKQETFIWKVKQGKSYWKNGEEDNMKFNAVVGNPPYQEEGANNNKKDPIYPYFWDASIKISDLVTLITPARFLFDAGQTSKEWNRKMLNDEHFKVISYFDDCKTVFPTADIKGGVAIGLRDNDVKFGPIKEFIPNSILSAIANKFANQSEQSLSSIVYGGRSDLKFNDLFLKQYPQSINDRLKAIQAQHPAVNCLSQNEEYELKSSTFSVLPYVFKESQPENSQDYYKITGLLNLKRYCRWIEKKYMVPRYPENNNIEKYKVFVPESNGSGSFGETLSNPFVGIPGESSTPTFISLGSFKTKEEADNVEKYIKTKLARTLLGVCKKTQHNPKATWSYIPLQDFTPNSDIDWSQSIDDIDKQLFKKYGLTQEEIDFINANVKPMK